MPPISAKGLLLHILVEHFTFILMALVAIAGRFGDIKPGFWQLLLTQTWVKCTSLDSSRCVVYSGITFKAIRAASKRLEQDE